METGGIILIVCSGIFVLTIILIGCLGKMREKRTVTNEPINQKSRDAGGFTVYPAAAYLPPVSSSAHHDCRMKQTRSNVTASVSSNHGYGGGGGYHGGGGGGGGGGHHDGGGGGSGCELQQRTPSISLAIKYRANWVKNIRRSGNYASAIGEKVLLTWRNKSD
ncbi:unnamed protein product [Brassica napus]|uniref:(rape) hypothetical protein n=1 Tax=Brassica napus TaxID=3708 RepID=A0A816Q9X1_BRANA|nr:unnamed protein product [Brassica napus]